VGTGLLQYGVVEYRYRSKLKVEYGMPEKEISGLADFRAMREHLLRLEKRDEEERYHKAWKAARELAVMLKDRYEVKEVYLLSVCGSAFRGTGGHLG
jgi:hypothetical protein